MNQILRNFLDDIPDYKEFMTADEMDSSSRNLARKYHDTVELINIGKSTKGNTILCLKIGDESRYPNTGLMLGCPHPNEPIGAMMLEYFCEALAGNPRLVEELGYTWYVIKAWDYDGLKLNEGWLKGPFSITGYARNYYRPPFNKQVEWTFPLVYKSLVFNEPLPETQAVMSLIEKIKPKFMYSLHNSSFGGAYWYLSDDIPSSYEKLHKAVQRQDIPLEKGVPEMPYLVSLYDAIYRMTTTADEYEYLLENGIENPADEINMGTSSYDYAKKFFDTFTLITELPYFINSSISNSELTENRLSISTLERLEFEHNSKNKIARLMDEADKFIGRSNPFKLSLLDNINTAMLEAECNMVKKNPDFEKPAKVSEEFSNYMVSKFSVLLLYGMLVRMFEYELDRIDNQNDKTKVEILSRGFNEATQLFNELSDYLESNLQYHVASIKQLVTITLESALHVLSDL